MGANNRGKSSVLQALGFLKQSIIQDNFQTNGVYASLGSFKDIVFKHDGRRRIEVSCYIILTEKELTEISNRLGEFDRFPLPVPFDGLDLSEVGFTWTFSATRDLVMSCLTDAKEKKIGCGSAYEPYIKDERFSGYVNEFGIRRLIPRAISGDSFVNRTFNNVMSTARKVFIQRFSGNLFYLMTRRGIEVRDQDIGGPQPSSVGPHGEYTIPILAFIRDDPEFRYLVNKLNEWATRFGFERVFSLTPARN